MPKGLEMSRWPRFPRLDAEDKALELFRELPRQRLERNLISYGAGTAACARGALWQLALVLLKDLDAGTPGKRDSVEV